MVAVVPGQIAEELTVTVGTGTTVTMMLTGSPTQPWALVSTTFRFAVPTLVQFTDIRLELAPGMMVPLPPAKGVMVQE